MQILAAFAAYARDAQRGKQREFQHAFAGNERLKGDRRPAEQVIVLGDYGFDVVAPGGEQSLVLLRTCGVGLKLGFQVLGIPDAVAHSAAVAMDERLLFRRIDSRSCASTAGEER